VVKKTKKSHTAFRGRYYYNIDTKGRLSIPSQFREVLRQKYKDERLMVTFLGNSLGAYPMTEWTVIEKKLSNLSQMSPEVRKFQLLFISGAVECICDEQGRILIPPALREDAGLKKEVVIAGMINRFEIWDKSRWETEMKTLTENFEQISKVLGELGI